MAAATARAGPAAVNSTIAEGVSGLGMTSASEPRGLKWYTDSVVRPVRRQSGTVETACQERGPRRRHRRGSAGSRADPAHAGSGRDREPDSDAHRRRHVHTGSAPALRARAGPADARQPRLGPRRHPAARGRGPARSAARPGHLPARALRRQSRDADGVRDDLQSDAAGGLDGRAPDVRTGGGWHGGHPRDGRRPPGDRADPRGAAPQGTIGQSRPSTRTRPFIPRWPGRRTTR